ncbi:unknown protein [Grouper iridovirus]|uniref:Uncharacterized protein n=1 Tax=Grouper iridovirus TaxID=127569 RepID=Q5GAF5_9VIRU|nr:unknown protein [Grouper iridovirus]
MQRSINLLAVVMLTGVLCSNVSIVDEFGTDDYIDENDACPPDTPAEEICDVDEESCGACNITLIPTVSPIETPEPEGNGTSTESSTPPPKPEVPEPEGNGTSTESSTPPPKPEVPEPEGNGTSTESSTPPPKPEVPEPEGKTIIEVNTTSENDFKQIEDIHPTKDGGASNGLSPGILALTTVGSIMLVSAVAAGIVYAVQNKPAQSAM